MILIVLRLFTHFLANNNNISIWNHELIMFSEDYQSIKAVIILPFLDMASIITALDKLIFNWTEICLHEVFF